MISRRPPWWMYVVTASFLLLLLLQTYLVIWGPAFPVGLEAVFEEGTMHIRSVTSGTAFAQGGLQGGDRVVSVIDLPTRNAHDWATVLANVQAERAQTWEIERSGERIQRTVTFERATWKNRMDNGVPFYLVLNLVFFLVGLFICFSRPHDPVARIGAWLFLTTSVAFGLLNGWAALWRQTPALLQLILWIPEISRFVIEGIFLSLFVVFPRRLFQTRWPWFVIWIPVLATLPWRAEGFYSMIYRPGQGATILRWFNQVIFLRTMLYVTAGLLLLLINYRWLADLNERRRIRVLILGTAIGLAAGVYTVWIYYSQGYGIQPAGILSDLTVLMIVACPLSFAYAILRHRVLDIHVIIRQGLQYALARGLVLGVVPALVAILIVDLAVNSKEPLATIVAARGWAYAGVGGLALVASFRRKQWLEVLDRRFFRERYDSQRILREIAEQVRESASLEPVAARVVARIETALHSEFVAVMMQEQTGGEYRCVASVPAGHACPPIDANSKLVGLLRVLGKPLEVLLADSVWLQARLPEKEIEFIERARIDLLVPIRTAPGRPEALLALGIKLSEEPYTGEDQDLLETICSSLTRLLEQPAAVAVPVSSTFEECPQCGSCYDAKTGRCAIEGESLMEVHLPRTLAGRYRLESRRGRGGMGTVYAATDQALERRVAVKVIRDDRVSSADIAQRFHREARVAAAFAHPNVVTVHDYGIEAGTRAFLVMELLEGGTLRDEVNRCKRIDPSRIIPIFRGVCAAVEAAHRRPLIHRDLKPENIFLAHAPNGTEEIVKVLDFGIAKFIPVYDANAPTRATTETNAGMLVGTLGYMSPEQLTGENPAVSWDLWALAVVAYETLTGSMPFPAKSTHDWRLAIVASHFTPLTEHLPESPHRWQMFFEQAFATDPRTRASSASDFLRRLEDALS